MKLYIMATKNPRINVTFEETTAGLLSHLAHQEHKSAASLVRELALEALEMREDFYLSKVAEKLDKDGVKTYSHDDAWK
jgi:predicted DNA-binding protein